MGAQTFQSSPEDKLSKASLAINSKFISADLILTAIHFFSPISVLLFFLVCFTTRSIRVSTPDNSGSNVNGNGHSELYGPGGRPLPQRQLTGLMRRQDKKNDFRPYQKLAFQILQSLATLSFLGNAAAVVIHVLVKRGWWCGQEQTVYVIGSFMVYTVLNLTLIETKPSPTWVLFSTWLLTLLLEAVRLVCYLKVNLSHHRLSKWKTAEVIISLSRVLILLGLVLLYITFTHIPHRPTLPQPAPRPLTAEESVGLLNAQHNGQPRSAANGYGTVNGATRTTNGGTPPSVDTTSRPRPDRGDSEPGWVRPDKVPSRSWWDYIRGYSTFFPYLWPKRNPKLQLTVGACFLLVGAQRALNVMVPLQLGVITDILSGETGPVRMPWKELLFFICFRLLQGSQSLLNVLRSILWIPIQQYSYRELSVASFEHVHSLSLDFHLSKKTGEVISALGKGNSINSFLDQLTFNVIPMIIDLCVAMGYFLIAFDAYYALAITVMTFWYIYMTIRLAKRRQDARRTMVTDSREQDAIKTDSLSSFETVKYFNAEQHEFNRYRSAVEKYQNSEYTVNIALSIMNLAQNLIFMGGLLVVCYIAAFQVTQKQIRVGKFVTLLTYMSQLQVPLNYFGTFYKSVQSSMINAERLLELFKEKATVSDKDGATELESCNGDIRFRNVQFAYDKRKNALNGMDFHCRPNTTTALVGESGGGKSTVFRLLFRFYNCAEGGIDIDGHDVQDITIESLRRHIGVVPQDTVLFNETIMYNLKYAKSDATIEEVHEACRAACIHDKIMSFPDGYKTKVGERGQRLSGGEKQRVAIARLILKGPPIILLDEATAALDSGTERHIQDAFKALSRGRTVLVIAHRLSTIARADQILVLKGGKVSERGDHNKLIKLSGDYATMWKKQVEAQVAAKEASNLYAKVDRLRRESKGDVNLERYIPTSNETSDSENEEDRRRRLGRVGKHHDETRHNSDDEQTAHHEALRMRHNE
ncbi:hypothetical protein BT63DRAFT_250078 [Microthyrium microscopicum]|uniref:Heavy metal tolerance protein n=1 Tax=Microthyrium microscopicum TaxID=703497 RepID=A0A6A6UA12_9PEZI|nr:hypothetical protein BT63DRAFT_250078 [Microthyrium microscopicum]